MVENSETVIVGGEIAGLACAYTFSSKDKEFIVLSKDIGGRLKI